MFDLLIYSMFGITVLYGKSRQRPALT